VYESGVTPGALALFPAVEFAEVPAAAVVFGDPLVDDELPLLLLHAAATRASTAMSAAAP